MATQHLEATVRLQDLVAVVGLTGDIDGAAQGALDTAYSEAVDHGPQALLLDFKGVGYINSTGIALIVNLLAKARGSSLPVGTSGLSDHYEEIFRITRLSDFMTIFPDEETGLMELRNSAT